VEDVKAKNRQGKTAVLVWFFEKAAVFGLVWLIVTTLLWILYPLVVGMPFINYKFG
jgi:hypothetical protein